MNTAKHKPTCEAHHGKPCNCIYGLRIKKLFKASAEGPTGDDLRDEGMASVDKHTGQAWRDACDAEIRRLAATGKWFTANDVRDVVGYPPHHPNAMGSRFMAAVKAGIIEHGGYIKSPRKEARSRALKSYTGKL